MLPLLHIKNLSVGFHTDTGYQTVLHNISFDVQRGEVVAIVGESGSGKSVTSLSVMQLLPVGQARYEEGLILFSPDGNLQTDLLGLPEAQVRGIRGNEIAMIFQEPMTSLNPVYTCGDQVAEAIRLHQQVTHAAAMQQTLALFEKVKLPDPLSVYKRYPHQLSGGQKQRVMIAIAMSCNPSLLIADEPTTALDVTVQKTILLLIKELQQQYNMGVIFITHDLGVVAAIADRIIVMYKGNVVEQGPAKQVLLAPQHPYTKSLLACRPAMHPKGVRLPVASDFMTVSATGEITEKMPNRTHAIAGAPPAAVHPVRIVKEAQALMRVKDCSVWFAAQKSFLGTPLRYTKAVDAVSFEVMEGETLGLVGESGCGKTTLGRTLLRLIEPTGGSILYKGTDLLSLSPESLRRVRKDMQIIFQDPFSSLNPRITVGQSIQEPLAVHGMFGNRVQQKEKVMELLGKVNLKPEHYHRYPHEFSGGQRQRIVIARALALQPAFIICDESVSSLDVSVQAQVLNLLNDLKKEFGFTAIFISHDLAVVKYISDRIMVMRAGKIIETGDAETLFNKPQAAYTQQLIDAIPKV